MKRNLWKPAEFFKAYFDALRQHDSNKAAYEAIEKEFEEQYGEGPKYGSYSSFRAAYSRDWPKHLRGIATKKK